VNITNWYLQNISGLILWSFLDIDNAFLGENDNVISVGGLTNIVLDNFLVYNSSTLINLFNLDTAVNVSITNTIFNPYVGTSYINNITGSLMINNMSMIVTYLSRNSSAISIWGNLTNVQVADSVFILETFSEDNYMFSLADMTFNTINPDLLMISVTNTTFQSLYTTFSPIFYDPSTITNNISIIFINDIITNLTLINNGSLANVTTQNTTITESNLLLQDQKVEGSTINGFLLYE